MNHCWPEKSLILGHETYKENLIAIYVCMCIYIIYMCVLDEEIMETKSELYIIIYIFSNNMCLHGNLVVAEAYK